MRLPWCAAFSTRSADGASASASVASTAGPTSPGRISDTAPNRSSSTTESSLRGRRRFQSGAGGCSTRTSTPRDARLPAGCDGAPFGPRGCGRAPHDVEHGQAGNGHALPHLRRRDQRRSGPAAPPTWSASAWVRSSASSARTPCARSAGATIRAPMSKRLPPSVPPASTSHVRAVRKADQRGVALADVERDDAQPAPLRRQRRCADTARPAAPPRTACSPARGRSRWPATPASHTAAIAARSRRLHRTCHSAHHAPTTAAASHSGGGVSVQDDHGAASTRLALPTMPAAAHRATAAGTTASTGWIAAAASSTIAAACTSVISGTAAKLSTSPASVAWPKA